jgi:hypothetical protein
LYARFPHRSNNFRLLSAQNMSSLFSTLELLRAALDPDYVEEAADGREAERVLAAHFVETILGAIRTQRCFLSIQMKHSPSGWSQRSCVEAPVNGSGERSS